MLAFLLLSVMACPRCGHGRGCCVPFYARLWVHMVLVSLAHHFVLYTRDRTEVGILHVSCSKNKVVLLTVL